jgi:hypothetical protein
MEVNAFQAWLQWIPIDFNGAQWISVGVFQPVANSSRRIQLVVNPIVILAFGLPSRCTS